MSLCPWWVSCGDDDVDADDDVDIDDDDNADVADYLRGSTVDGDDDDVHHLIVAVAVAVAVLSRHHQ